MTGMTGVLRGRGLVAGTSEGEAVVSGKPIAFLGGVDPDRGMVVEKDHDLAGVSLQGRVLVFPNSIGSSVGAYVIYRLQRGGRAPVAIVNRRSDTITVTGCAIAGIPLVDLPRGGFGRLRTGLRLSVDGGKGLVRILKRVPGRDGV